MADMARLVVRDADSPRDALEAEQWASSVLGSLEVGRLGDAKLTDMFRSELCAAVELIGTRKSLATLRAFGAVGTETLRAQARVAADRISGASTDEPAWVEELGTWQPARAMLMSDDEFDDGLAVIVEFAGADSSSHTLGVCVDHNLGGLVKDVYVAGPLGELRGDLRSLGSDGSFLGLRDLDLAEARARIASALDVLDHTYDPPVDPSVRALRAFIEARLALLPPGGEHQPDVSEMSMEERGGLVEDFLACAEGGRWRDDDEAKDVIATVINFGADYNYGGPLRWSPTVVEIFMTSWLPRKVIDERSFFERVAEVLPDWVAYAGRRCNVRRQPLDGAISAVANCRDAMLEAIDDTGTWGPAKAFVAAAQSGGVDLSDSDAVERFTVVYNEQLGAR
jgi:hypothetical protein